MLVLTARLPAEEGALLVAALERARTALSATPADPDAPADPAAEAAGCAPGDRPDPDELATAADAVVAVAQAALAAGDVDSSGDDEHLVVLHADIEVLTSKNPPAEADCRIEHGSRRGTGDRGTDLVRRRGDRGVTHRGSRRCRCGSAARPARSHRHCVGRCASATSAAGSPAATDERTCRRITSSIGRGVAAPTRRT